MSTPEYENQEYKDHKQQVKLVNDFYCGVDTARSYLSQFPREDTEKYKDRQSRATLDNNVLETVNTISNVVFRKDLDIEGVKNASVQEWIKKIDFRQDLNSFGKELLRNRKRDGYTFLLVDSPSFDEEIINSQLIAQEQNIRPYFVNILRKNVINWKLNKFNEYERFTIREFYTDTTDQYNEEQKEQIKVWFDNGTVEVWREGSLFQTIGTGINKVPVFRIGNDMIPPLYDMAKSNNMHFNLSSQYDNYVEVGAAPFLAVFAFTQSDAPKTLGINDGLTFDDKQSGDVKWVEMTGNNAEIIKSRIEQHKQIMNDIAISFATSSNVKTATQVESEKTEDESKLVNYADELEEGLNAGLEMMQLYESVSLGENTVKVNRDFSANILSPEEANSYRLDFAQGIISIDRLLDIYEDGEYLKKMTEPERNAEKLKLLDGEGFGELGGSEGD